MTGYVTMCDGRRSALPALLQWDIKLTDGDPCDGFSVCFPYERALAQTLRGAVFFTAEEDGATVFTGVVDDYEITLDAKGLLAEMTGRGMAARLLDNQVRAAEYLSAQLADILKSYVLPYGVTKLRAVQMPAVERFVVETGYSCWQVLAGFCRHSADIFPRFLPDGTLVLEPETPGKTVRLRQAVPPRAGAGQPLRAQLAAGHGQHAHRRTDGGGKCAVHRAWRKLRQGARHDGKQAPRDMAHGTAASGGRPARQAADRGARAGGVYGAADGPRGAGA